jgi:hypothetical protein
MEFRKPENVQEIQRFIFACNWMRSKIPELVIKVTSRASCALTRGVRAPSIVFRSVYDSLLIDIKLFSFSSAFVVLSCF